MGQNITNTNLTTMDLHSSEDIVPDVVLMSLYLIIGSVGNITMIVLYHGDDQQKTKAHKQFIFILAIVDLVSCILNCFLNISLVTEPDVLRNSAFCKVLRFCCHVTTITSAFILVVIALQRYFLICKPFKKQMTPVTRITGIIICFVLSLAISSPVLVFYGSSELNLTGSSLAPPCDILDRYFGSEDLLAYNIFFMCVTLSVVGSISIMYLAILKTLYLKKKTRKKSYAVKYVSRSNTSADQPKATVINYSMLSLNTCLYNSNSSLSNIRRKPNLSLRQHMLTLMFFIVTLCCILSFAPRRMIEFVEAIDKDVVREYFGQHRFLYRFFRTLYILNNVVNPYIYGLFDSDLRHKLKTCLKRYTCK